MIESQNWYKNKGAQHKWWQHKNRQHRQWQHKQRQHKWRQHNRHQTFVLFVHFLSPEYMFVAFCLFLFNSFVPASSSAGSVESGDKLASILFYIMYVQNNRTFEIFVVYNIRLLIMNV